MANLAFISSAHIHTGAFIDEIARQRDGRRVHAVWDDHVERGQRFAAHAKAPFVASLDAVLADPAIDGFIIASENTRHVEFLERVLPIGKPVFCEKPLVTSHDEIKRVRELRRIFPAPLICGYFHPFSAEMRTAAALLADGSLGRITRARFRNSHHGAYARWFDHPHVAWLRDPALAAGGGFLDLGTHAIHQLHVLFGRVVSVWAQIHHESHIYPGIDDFGLAHLRFESGVFATAEASWTQTGGLHGLEITGTQRALWNTPTGYVVGAPEKAPEPLPRTLPAEPARIDRLVATIRGEISLATLEIEVEAALHTAAIATACYRSAKTGRWVGVARI